LDNEEAMKRIHLICVCAIGWPFLVLAAARAVDEGGDHPIGTVFNPESGRVRHYDSPLLKIGSAEFKPTMVYRGNGYRIYYGYRQASGPALGAAFPAWVRNYRYAVSDKVFPAVARSSSSPGATITWVEARAPEKQIVLHTPQTAKTRALALANLRYWEAASHVESRSIESPDAALPPIAERTRETSAESAPARELPMMARSGKLDTLQMLSELIERDPGNVTARYTRGNLYHEMKDFPRAIEDYSAVIQLDLQNAAAYYKRGLCYTAMRREDLAASDFRDANRFAPPGARPWSKMSGEWTPQLGY
jgi:tetratricopeptide repeat protein